MKHSFGHFSNSTDRNEDGVDLSKRFLIIFRSLIDGKDLYQFIAISMGRMMINDDKWWSHDDHMMINMDKPFFCWVKSPWFHGFWKTSFPAPRRCRRSSSLWCSMTLAWMVVDESAVSEVWTASWTCQTPVLWCTSMVSFSHQWRVQTASRATKHMAMTPRFAETVFFYVFFPFFPCFFP